MGRRVRAVPRSVLAAGLLLLAVAFFLAAGPAPARAAGHAQLIGTMPASGQTVTTAPASVRLTFSGNVISIGLQFQVIGPTGLVTRGTPVIDLGTVTQPLAASLANGTYVVNWHVVHDDGHPDSGTFSFGVDAAGGPQATDANGTPITAGPTTLSAPGNGGGTSGFGDETPQGLPPLVIAGGVLLIVVVVVIAVIADRRRTPADS